MVLHSGRTLLLFGIDAARRRVRAALESSQMGGGERPQFYPTAHPQASPAGWKCRGRAGCGSTLYELLAGGWISPALEICRQISHSSPTIARTPGGLRLDSGAESTALCPARRPRTFPPGFFKSRNIFCRKGLPGGFFGGCTLQEKEYAPGCLRIDDFPYPRPVPLIPGEICKPCPGSRVGRQGLGWHRG